MDILQENFGRSDMTVRRMLNGGDTTWNIAIIFTATSTLVLNATGLIFGISIVLPHLFYIPVVITSYHYPRRGLLFAAAIAAAYIIMVSVLTAGSPAIITEALVRGVVIVIIGGLIAFLSRRLREREDLYQGLFDHSEAGSILLKKNPGEHWMVEAANRRAMELLGIPDGTAEDLPVTSFWNAGYSDPVFLRLIPEEKIVTTETLFTTGDGDTVSVLFSIALLPEGRAILTFENISRRVAAERALQTANDKLNLLSRISTDHLQRTVNKIITATDTADHDPGDIRAKGCFDTIKKLALSLARQLSIARTYKDLGRFPPEWIPVQQALLAVPRPPGTEEISIRFWTERLMVYADPLIRDVLNHLVDNALRHGKTTKNLVVTWQESKDGLDIIIRDDGTGIPADCKETIFEYNAEHTGLGLFICRQILAVTGITIFEDGKEGEGARFVIRIPDRYFSIEGTGDDVPELPTNPGISMPGPGAVPHSSGTLVKELVSVEFPLAESLWIDYHETKGNPSSDRIFGAFSGSELVSVARCKRHPDGFEVDGVFTPDRFRGKGYANAAVWGLIEACGGNTLYMHSVANLTGFYGHYGFVPIPEQELPDIIRERYAWAQGEMAGANVCPMRRDPTP